jgi:hypothetical protein
MHLLIPDLARDRAAELAQESRRPRRDPSPRAGRRRRVRHLLAIALVRLSLASAAAVRRLDACLADDLLRPIARPDGA